MTKRQLEKALSALVIIAAVIVIIEYVFIAYCGGLSSL